MPRRLAIALAILAVFTLGVHPASAEWFADLYAGLSFTQDHDLKLDDHGIGRGTYEDVSFDKSLAWGGRAGRYFDSLPFLGLGLDVFRYYPTIGPQSVDLRGCFFPGGCGSGRGGPGSFEVQPTAVSVDLMLRLPLLKSDDAPQGRLQPYVLVGPPLFITTITPRHTRTLRNNDSDTDYSIGSKTGPGVPVQRFPTPSLFPHY